MGELENVSNKMNDLVKGFLSQSVKGSAWLLLAGYGQMREEENKLKEELLNQKSQDLFILKLAILSRWETMQKQSNGFWTKIKSRHC